MKVQKKNEFEWVEEVHVVNIHKEEASLGKIGLYFYECVLVNIMACVTLLTEMNDFNLSQIVYIFLWIYL